MPRNQPVHPLVRLDYFVRLLGAPMAAALVASGRLQTEAPRWQWAVILLYAFVWPHLAYVAGRRARDPRMTERWLLLVDCAFAGAGLPLVSFRPVVVLSFLTCCVAFLASVGGWSMLGAGLPVIAGSALLVGWLGPGFHVASSTSWVETALAATILFAFQFVMSIQTWNQARGFVANRRRIAEQAEEIQRQNEELREAREQALQAAQAKAAFLATMSHEIRTPLNGVLGMTRLLAESPLNHEQHDFVATIQTSGQALLAIINDVLDYSKIESGHMELEDEPLRVSDVLEEALEMVAERARAKELELVYHVEPGVPPTIRGDITRLRQILTNLVGNAVKFTSAGEVVVSARLVRAETADEPAEIEFAVRDTGVGIPADRIPQLFSAFVQVDASTTRRYGGTGLGLAISKRLTELMGGRVSVRSTLKTGSTFSFTVRARAAAHQPVRTWDPRLVSGRRVLVVDDNETNRRVLCGQLAAWGFAAEPAESAAAALRALAGGEPFGLAVLDLHMPEVDGLELASRIRALGLDLPLVLLSSSPLSSQESAGLFAARLLKPARQSRLFDAVARALGAQVPTFETIPPTSLRWLAELAPLRLLVVDDNEVNRRLAGLVLRRFGYRPDFAVNGREAVDQVLEHLAGGPEAPPYDIVFMDVHMPEMDGMTATRTLRLQQEARPGARWPKIVAMTADAMQGDREACLEAGMDDYLTKPLEFEAVQALLEQEVSRRVGRPLVAPAPAPAPPTAAEPAPAVRRSANGPVLVDWSRLSELKAYDTPDGAVVRAAVGSFSEQAPMLLARLREHVDKGDAPAVRESAHALKGSASNVGAVALASMASSVEQAGRSGVLHEVPPLLALLGSLLEGTLTELRQEAS